VKDANTTSEEGTSDEADEEDAGVGN